MTPEGKGSGSRFPSLYLTNFLNQKNADNIYYKCISLVTAQKINFSINKFVSK